MRGWITARHGTCAVQLPLDDAQELLRSTVDVVVDDHVIKLLLLVELLLRPVQPLLDFAAFLRGPCSQPALQFREGRCANEDRDAVGDLPFYGECADGFKIEERCLPFRTNATDLR